MKGRVYDMNDLQKRLYEVIIKNGDGLSFGNLDNSLNLIDDFGFDSLNLIQMVVEIENEFNIEFEDEHLVIEVLSNLKKLEEIIQVLVEG